MDHAPGPIIAVVPLSVPRTIGIHGSLMCVIATQSSTMKISAPTIGVQRPTSSSIAAQAAIRRGIIGREKGSLEKPMILERTNRMAVRMR